ncbi:PIN domain-containing protein [Vineibacter terrae]|uniref:PIN domain-containing protein n=1 Tax=Vineibacter terrae TaxID=2586908 RepID=UPI0015B77754|nr:PIN domain-containing protein [Vineibacter terrae]
MLRILVDTCVWLDLAKDYRQQTLIQAALELVKSHQIAFIVPDVVKDEFARNKARVAEDAQRSLQAHFKLVREAVGRFAEDDYKAETLKSLNEVDQRISMKGEAVNDSIEWIEELLATGIKKSTTKAIKQRVTERALTGTAPYHRSKNSAGDAVLIETYSEIVDAKSKRSRFAFVTHNTRDFSHPADDQRTPHPDLQPLFDGTRSVYWISLVDLLKAEFAGDLDNLAACRT